jgi:hypothetical protein
MSGVAEDGGRMTPSVRLSFSLRFSVEPVEDGSDGANGLGATFSAGMSRGIGMFGACC